MMGRLGRFSENQNFKRTEELKGTIKLTAIPILDPNLGIIK